VGLLLTVVAARPAIAYAQTTGANPWFVRAGITPAYILPDNPFALDHEAADPATTAPNLTFEIGRTTDGSQPWHHVYRMPSYGFGLSFVSYRNGPETGHPVEAYTFFSYPFAHLAERFDVTTDFGMGISWHWNDVNGAAANSRSVLGADVNARIDWGFYLRYTASPKLTMYGGVDYTHRSNGGLVQPDQGINVIGPKVIAQYNFSAAASRQPRGVLPPFAPSWEVVVGAAGGAKNTIEQSAPLVRADFGALDVTVALQRQFYRFGKIAAGTDLTYDGSTGACILASGQEWRTSLAPRWAIGLYGGYEHVIGRFGAVVQVGDNVHRGYETTPRLYARYGWRYHFNDRLWSTFAIRANDVRKANALEIGAGFRFRSHPGFDHQSS